MLIEQFPIPLLYYLCMNLGQDIKYGIFFNTQKIDLDKTHELMGGGGGRGETEAKRGIFQGVPPPLCMKP